MLNTFAMTFVYLNAVLVTNGSGVELNIYNSYLISDAFFGTIYVSMGDYLYVSGFFGYAVVPRIFMTISLYVYYDDRLPLIAYYFVLTFLIHIATGLVAEEILIDC